VNREERLRTLVGKKIIDVEIIEDGVSNYYAFTLDDGTILRFSHDDAEGMAWVDQTTNLGNPDYPDLGGET